MSRSTATKRLIRHPLSFASFAHCPCRAPWPKSGKVRQAPRWKPLPRRKLPNHTDFISHGNDLAARVKAWDAAAGAAQQLADEYGEWVERPDLGRVWAL